MSVSEGAEPAPLDQAVPQYNSGPTLGRPTAICSVLQILLVISFSAFLTFMLSVLQFMRRAHILGLSVDQIVGWSRI